jgi:HSP20 family protein
MLALWNQFDDLLNDDFFRARRAAPPAFAPAVDIVETEKGYELAADLPGLSAQDVDITVEDGVLTISGERKDERVDEKKGYRRVERTFGTFKRAFTLPKGVSVDQITARVEHGQLRVLVPKPVTELPRKVRVETVGQPQS